MKSYASACVDLARQNSKTLPSPKNTFTPREITSQSIRRGHSRFQSVAARYAAKAALIQLFRQEGRDIEALEFEFVRQNGGRGQFRISDKASGKIRTRDFEDLSVSLTHSRLWAVALVARSL